MYTISCAKRGICHNKLIFTDKGSILSDGKGVGEMVLICDCKYCHYEFERMTKTAKCPECGKETVRAATPEEARAYQARKKENVWGESVPAMVG